MNQTDILKPCRHLGAACGCKAIGILPIAPPRLCNTIIFSSNLIEVGDGLVEKLTIEISTCTKAHDPKAQRKCNRFALE